MKDAPARKWMGAGEGEKDAPLLMRLRGILAPAKVLNIELSGHLSYTLRAIPYAHRCLDRGKEKGPAGK